MVNCKSFQIIFEEPGAPTHSATFDVAIPPECKGKFVDVKGEVLDMSQLERTLHSESTLTNIIHIARKVNDSQCSDPDNLCCIDVSSCNNFFKNANMKGIVNDHCCGDRYCKNSCVECLYDSARYYTYKAANTIESIKGESVFTGDQVPTTILGPSGDNLVISNGGNAAHYIVGKTGNAYLAHTIGGGSVFKKGTEHLKLNYNTNDLLVIKSGVNTVDIQLN